MFSLPSHHLACRKSWGINYHEEVFSSSRWSKCFYLEKDGMWNKKREEWCCESQRRLSCLSADSGDVHVKQRAPTFSALWLVMCWQKFSSCSGDGTDSGAMPYGIEHKMSHSSWSCSSRSFRCCILRVLSFVRASTCVRMFFSCWSMLTPSSSLICREQIHFLTRFLHLNPNPPYS